MSALLSEIPDASDPLPSSASSLGFALCHGWGLDASSMAPLAEALTQSFPEGTTTCRLVDLGFGGAPRLPVLEPDRHWIAIGHSYGFAWLLQQPDKDGAAPFSWQAVVAINGFTRFCRQPGRPEGTPPRLLEAMLARLASAPAATVQEFRQRCGFLAGDPAFPAADLDALQAEGQATPRLQALQRHLQDLLPLDVALPDCPVLALATEADVIVPPTLARACFSSAAAPDRRAPLALRLLPGDHVSLLRQPALLAGLIHRWLDKNDD